MDDDFFSGWGLRSVELQDQPIFKPFFASLSQPLSDYTFSQIYTWRNSLRILWTQLEGHLCVFANGSGDLTLLLPPIGSWGADKALRRAFELMDDYNASHGVPGHSRVEYASQELLSRLDRGKLDVEPMRHDYIYDVRRMIDLAGGDLKSKRQERNRFVRDHSFRVETYDNAAHRSECLLLLQSWKNHQDAHDSRVDGGIRLKRRKESLATELALGHDGELGLRGMVVYADDRLSGFTFGEPLCPTQSSIVIEKTDLRIKGLAQFIFSEFCRRCWSEHPLVNVGDDWGISTLAWTKMSYRPVQLLPKFVLRKRSAVCVGFASAPQASTRPAIIRHATAADLASVTSLESNCFSTYCLSKRQLKHLSCSHHAIFLVAEQSGQIVGDGIALLRTHRRGVSGRIYSLAVRADCRGQHLGRTLLDAMLDELSRRGAQRVYLEVQNDNAPAIALYERAGFQRIGDLPDYYGPGRNGTHMMRNATRANPATVVSRDM